MPGQAVATGLLPVPAPCRGVARQPGRGKGEGATHPNPAGQPIEASTALREGFGEGGKPSTP